MCLAAENNPCPALDPCIQKEASGMESDDRLSELPNDVLVFILSFLTTEEIRRTSVVCKKWRRWVLGYYPKLIFKFEGVMRCCGFWYENRNNDEALAKQRSTFVRRVDHIMNQYLDSSMDELRVAFDLDKNCQSHVDNWVSFALRRRVKAIDFNFRPVYWRLDTDDTRCGFSPLPHVTHSLTSLSLSTLRITSEAVESILVSCPVLESLTIFDCRTLTSIISSVCVSSLKHLEVTNCFQLQTIDIFSAPKMVVFRYDGHPIELNIGDATSLSSVFIGAGPGEEISYAFTPLSNYFPRLEVLILQLSLNCPNQCNNSVEHLQFPILTRLKVLELRISGHHNSSLLGWAPFIEACPVIEKLILKFDCLDYGINGNIAKGVSRSPLTSLKKLEIYGYCGRRVDIQFAAYVFENAINLQHVFVEVELTPYKVSSETPIRVRELKEIIPEGVSFVLKESE